MSWHPLGGVGKDGQLISRQEPARLPPASQYGSGMALSKSLAALPSVSRGSMRPSRTSTPGADAVRQVSLLDTASAAPPPSRNTWLMPLNPTVPFDFYPAGSEYGSRPVTSPTREMGPPNDLQSRSQGRPLHPPSQSAAYPPQQRARALPASKMGLPYMEPAGAFRSLGLTVLHLTVLHLTVVHLTVLDLT